MDVSKPVFYTKKADAPTPHVFVDAFSAQLKELFIITHPHFAGPKKKEGFASGEFQKFVATSRPSVFVYYPWNNHLVHTMTEEDYSVLKTNRNQDLITTAEQVELFKYSVAVLGMSVGSNIAFVLTQAGISKDVYLADYDELDTTNLNRILAGVHQVGLNKTVVAARRIYEDNPFAVVHTMTEGVTHDNLETLLREKKIQCIVEEIDDLPMKLMTRQLASKYKVPVIMITDNGDGVVLHVERYDLGYAQVFEKPFQYWEEKMGKKATMEEMGQIIVNDILGGPDQVPPRVFASVGRVMKGELVSWSQLGSAAILGGVVATIAIKDIALGHNKTPYIAKNIQITF